MTKAAAETGMGLTMFVAIEQNFPKNERIIEDDIAYQMLPFGMKSFVWLTRFNLVRDLMVRVVGKHALGTWGNILCRKRYIDEKLIDSMDHIDAVVNLGAGFDTRAYLPFLSEMPVWELDQLENIKTKQKRLHKVFGTIPSHVKLVTIDFDHEDLDTVLKSHDYSTTKRTFFIWEGVTQYLTEKGIRTTFDFLAKAAPGSRIAFTYVRKDFIDGRNTYGWEKKFVKDKVWIFGMEPGSWPKFLKEYGWQVIEDVGYDKMAKQYIKPTGRTLGSMQMERMVFAEKL